MSNFHLVQASESEIQEILHGNSQEWKGALSLEAYIRREDFLANQNLTRDGGLTSWALVEGEGSSRRLLSSCESIRKKALVARNGEIEDAIAHGVASVFCDPSKRGKGYAGMMIKKLGERLESWQSEKGNVLFSVLWSDIGKQFYAANKWYPFPSAHVALPAVSSHERLPSSLPESRPLYASDIAELCAIDEQLIRQHMAKAVSGDRTAVAIVPSVTQLQWHHAREEFVAKELYGKIPEVKGAIVGTEPGQRVWCYWTRVYTTPNETKDNTLHILRLVIEDPNHSDFTAANEEGVRKAHDSYIAKATASLFAAAQLEAGKWAMGQTDIWNPTSTTLAGAKMLDPSATVEHREKESIASLRWYGSEEGNPVEHVDWICNEKYGWC